MKDWDKVKNDKELLKQVEKLVLLYQINQRNDKLFPLLNSYRRRLKI